MIKINQTIKTIFLLLFFISCKSNISVSKLEYRKDLNFRKLKFEKVFEVDYYDVVNWCIPFESKVICLFPLGWRRTEYKLLIYDYFGNILKERKVRGGQGPNEIGGSTYSTIIHINPNEIISTDAFDYVKSINTNTLEVKTLGKISNLVRGWRAKYDSSHTFHDIERKDNSCITVFDSPGFWNNEKYFFVKFNGLFENFKVISSSKKKALKMEIARSRKRGRRVSLMDYYSLLKEAKFFSVDWKRGYIYYIPEVYYPIIEAVDFGGKAKKRYEINLDYKNFKIDRKKIELYCEFIDSTPKDALLLNLKYICDIPPHAPPLLGIKVIDDRLLIITGNRDWDKGKNETLIYKLPNMEYEGSTYIPFPNFLIPAWIDNYLITRNIVKKNDDFSHNLIIYRIELN